MKAIPTDVSDFLEYRPETGDFFWLKSQGGPKKGDMAGSISSNGYRYISFDRRRFLAHRLAWFCSHGRDPEASIDHINGNKLDNRICNLRLASQTQNLGNQRGRRNNPAGYKGVTKVKWGWMARIQFQGRQIYLGLFSSAQAAHAAYCRAAVELFGEFARAA